MSEAVETAMRAAEPTLDATAKQLRVAGNRATAVGRTAVEVARRQPALVILAVCGLALLWLNRRHPQAPLKQ